MVGSVGVGVAWAIWVAWWMWWHLSRMDCEEDEKKWTRGKVGEGRNADVITV